MAHYLDQAERGVIPAGTVLVADKPQPINKRKAKRCVKAPFKDFDFATKSPFAQGNGGAKSLSQILMEFGVDLFLLLNKMLNYGKRGVITAMNTIEKSELLKNGDLSVHFHARKNKKVKSLLSSLA